MNLWNVTLELGEPEATDERVDDLMDGLAEYHVAVSSGYRNRPRLTLSLPAESPKQALSTAIAVSEATGGGSCVYAEVVLTTEFDEREGFTVIPALMSASDAGEYLGVSRVRVNQMIVEGRFPTAQKVGSGYVIPHDAVATNGRLFTMIGFTGNLGIQDLDWDAVVGPVLDALALVGPVAAYNAAQAVENGELISSSLADAWHSAEKDALHELAMRGYDTTGIRLIAKRTSVQLGSR